ncbi:zf-PARP-domain-containing protein [Trametopsis cervina]|nr:zf-PARP-domain-containing protein [Trametopsis cervina]
MSGDEGGGKKAGYRLEYANSARAKCKGPKPCNGTPIGKDELRFGSTVDFKGNTSFAWRHWGCVTAKIITNMKKSFDEPDELDGFDELQEDDQEKVRKAWTDGHVADEDIPDSARKPGDGGDDDDDDELEKPKKKAAAPKGKKASDDEPAVFKLEYAVSARSKCKGGCDETIGKDYLRLAQEIDFRGKKSQTYQHWGCVSDAQFAKLKKSYSEPEKIEGYDGLQDADKEKIGRAWEEGAIPEDDKGPGDPAPGLATKRAPAKRTKKTDDGDKPPKKRARKAKKDEDDEVEEEDEEEEEKPKKRAPAKKAAPKKAPAKKRVSKKKNESDDEDAEDFGAAIDAVSEDEDEPEEEESTKKRKRAPASKASTSKPASKKAAAKAAPRKKKQQESEDEDEYE